MSKVINLEDNFKDVVVEIFNNNLHFKEITLNKEISLKRHYLKIEFFNNFIE